jgi:hypothetical protein
LGACLASRPSNPEALNICNARNRHAFSLHTMKKQKRDYLLLAGLTVLALFIHGYHLGIEDQSVYLPAIQKILNPGLFPHDSELFVPQTNLTMFGRSIAFLVRQTHFSCSTVLFIVYLISVFLILLGCLKLTRRLFHESYAQWAGVCLIACLLTIPVAGTALYLMDQYLHPRGLATFALLFAFLAVYPGEEPGKPVSGTRLTPGRLFWMLFWVGAAAAVHVMMAFYGAGLLIFLLWKTPRRATPLPAVVVLPFHQLCEPASAAWRKAARTRTQDYLLHWHWYEWLGIAGPLCLLEWFSRLGRRHGLPRVEHLSRRLALFGLCSFAFAAAATIPHRFERITPYQPLRCFHLVYLLLFLVGGSLLGKWILRKSLRRWLVLFVPLSLGMLYAQLQLFPASPHIEWPGMQNPNPWVQAFVWVRHNTPRDAYLALDPHFMALPGEDFHSFRAFAERSRMADLVKDPGPVSYFPDVADRWFKEVSALQGWKHFTAKDFHELKRRFGVNWVILQQPGVQGLNCPYQNSHVRVCRIE